LAETNLERIMSLVLSSKYTPYVALFYTNNAYI